MVRFLSLSVDFAAPNELRYAAKHESEQADHREARQESRRSHRGPVAKDGATGPPALSSGVDQQQAHHRLNYRLKQSKYGCAPDPLMQRIRRKVDRSQCEKNYGYGDERTDERMPVQLVAVRIGDDVQHSHDHSSDNRHLNH